MLKLVQLLALAAVVAIAASTPVSHLFQDDKVDMALEDLEVLADALDKETLAAADVNCRGCGQSTDADSSGCCPRGWYGPNKSQCQQCKPDETSVVGSEKSCQNAAITACSKCNACEVLSNHRICIRKCTAQTKPDCSLTATKDRSGKNIQAGACYKK